MKKKQVLLCAGVALTAGMWGQSQIDSLGVPSYDLKTVTVHDVNTATNNDPYAVSNLTSREISKINVGQDLPFLLRFTPSLTVTSDAGNGVGYTGLWIRGSDPSRVNVTINGVPLNDPESQQVFWVNTPDLASSTNRIQIQRGIGTSVNGTGSFGGSIHIDTDQNFTKNFARVSYGVGSFGTSKVTAETGFRVSKRFKWNGRTSVINSNGYIDRARTNLNAYFLKGEWNLLPETVDGSLVQRSLTAYVFGGKENTYQAWYGTPYEKVYGNAADVQAYLDRNGITGADATNLLNSGRTYNYYLYPNEIDNYKQHHAQLHFESKSKLSSFTRTTRVTGHFTHGEGYFEQFKQGMSLAAVGLPSVVNGSDTISDMNAVVQRWLNNNFIGIIASQSLNFSKGNITYGFAANHYHGKSYGRVVALGEPLLFFINHEYYRGVANKNDVNAFVKSQVIIRKHWLLNADLQGRVVNYATSGIDNDLSSYNVQKNLNFFNPKVGIRYNNEWNGYGFSLYTSVAHAGHEPNRNDYIDGGLVEPKPEYMTDFEGGLSFWKPNKFNFHTNVYYMNYTNQLVLTGALNDVGAPLRTNVSQSFRRGIENEIQWHVTSRLDLAGNITFSESMIKDFTEHVFNYDTYTDVAVARGNTPISFSPNRIAAAHAEVQVTNPLREGGLHLSVFANEKYVSSQHLDNTGNNETTIPSYATTDMGVNIHFSTKENESNRMNILFLVNNVFNRMYTSNGYAYSYIWGQTVTERFYYPQAGRNYMVTLSVKI